MTRSLARRIFLAMLTIGLINVVATLIATEVIYEDMEEANLTVALAEERRFFTERVTGEDVQSWQTALLTAYFVPRHQLNDAAAIAQLPRILQERPTPFAAEVEQGDRTFLVTVNAVRSPPGVMYLAQDISILENREDLLQEIGFALLTLLMSAVCLGLALFGARYVVRPIKRLSTQIRAISPDRHLAPIEPAYRDRELEEIRMVLNELLIALNTYVQREKGLVSMASHELRTPVAVITGALDVLDQRNTLSQLDRKTVERIRLATGKMQSDVSALLKLARRPENSATTHDLERILDAVVSELEDSNPDFRNRVVRQQTPQEDHAVAGDPDLIHMLVRNLLQNALRHTTGAVWLQHQGTTVVVMDTGDGLPEAAHEILTGGKTMLKQPEDGLGLYIVRLLTERLDCKLDIVTNRTGTVIRIELRSSRAPEPARGAVSASNSPN